MRLPRPRISIATIMMLVVTAATASALGARVVRLLGAAVASNPFGNRNLALLLVTGIVLTGVALAARKGHTANQAMLQIALACLGFLYPLSLPEVPSTRLHLFWLQTLFAVLVVVPLVARRALKRRLERGPRRTWWLGTCEAVAFAYFNMMLVLAGIGIEGIGIALLQ